MALNGADRLVVEQVAGDLDIIATWHNGPKKNMVAGNAAKLHALLTEEGNAEELLNQTPAEAASHRARAQKLEEKESLDS